MPLEGRDVESSPVFRVAPEGSRVMATAECEYPNGLAFSPNEHTWYVARFDRGVELSGGEWQKIALARAYIRDAQVLILDEPTASLDARAEYDVFLRFSHLVTGKMAVIISHRFSTVRMADRIIVLQHGTVVEDGTHEALVAQGGLYATLFALQAEGYR